MTPRRAIAPAHPTHEMKAAGAQGFGPGEGGYDIAHDIYARMIAASPNAGRISAADLERAIGAAAKEIVRTFGAPTMATAEKAIRAALEAIGLAIEGDAP